MNHSVTQILARAQQALQQNRPDQALQQVEQGLKLWPGEENLRFWQALLLYQNGQSQAGVEVLATLLQPQSPDDWLRAGLQQVLADPALHGLSQAAEWGRWLTGRATSQALDWYMLGCVLARRDAHAQAEQAFHQALKRQSELTQAHYELALCLHRQQRETEALEHFAACGPLEAQQPWFHYNHALSLQACGQPDAAIQALRQALERDARFLDARLRLAELLAREARWTELERERAVIIQQMEAGATAGNTSPYSADVAALPSVQRTLACAWAQRILSGVERLDTPRCPSTEKPGSQPLRLGYFGGDLNLSAVGSLLAAILPRHDPERVEVFGLSTHVTGDAMEARIRAACQHWLDLSALNDRQAAERIQALELDVLLDVSGYTRRGRPRVLAHRPVQLQVGLWGYLNRHCAPFIDALVADDFCARRLPADWDEPLWKHPHSLLPPRLDSQWLTEPVPDRQALGLPQDARVLASFNAVYKLHPALLRAWARILQQDPDSVLWLGGGGSPAAWQRVLDFLQQAGVAASRLIAAESLPLEAHLARLRQADLWLDTFPYNGGASVVAARTAGLPVLSLAGEGLLGRMSASLNRALGDDTGVADTVEAYIQNAIEGMQGIRPEGLSLQDWAHAWEGCLQAYSVACDRNRPS